MKNPCFNKLAFSDQNAHDLLKEYSSPFKWETVSARASLKSALQGHPVVMLVVGDDSISAMQFTCQC